MSGRLFGFESTSFGVGSLVRFKEVKSHPWTYAIYRGVTKDGTRVVSYDFADTPLGPITRWLAYWPKFIEAAVTTSPNTGGSNG